MFFEAWRKLECAWRYQRFSEWRPLYLTSENVIWSWKYLHTYCKGISIFLAVCMHLSYFTSATITVLFKWLSEVELWDGRGLV